MASMWDNLNGDFASRLRGLIAESGGRITMVSGYRSEARQQELWAQALSKYGSEAEARKWVAPPGHSNHNKGLAVDLGGDLQLAHQLAPKYGLNFPMGHEPWHIEPEGIKSSPDAYTTAPDDNNDGGLGSQPTDHVDTLMSNFSKLFNGEQEGGEASTSAVGEADTSQVGEGAVPTSLNTNGAEGADLSGKTATETKGPTGGDAKTNMELGRQVAAKYGWDSDEQWNALNQLIMSESGWTDAANPNSSARGIGQNIHGYSDNYQQGNVQQQIDWTYNYIKQRYGSPANAWQHKIDTKGQYGNAGGWY